jgi:hypothetical protein
MRGSSRPRLAFAWLARRLWLLMIRSHRFGDYVRIPHLAFQPSKNCALNGLEVASRRVLLSVAPIYKPVEFKVNDR